MARLQKKKLPAKKVNKTRNNSEGMSGADVSAGVLKVKAPSSGMKKVDKNSGKYSKASTGTGELNFVQKGIQFFKEVRIELRKVTWPTRKQTVNSTIVIIIFVFIIAAFLGMVDFGLSKLVQVVLA